MNTQTTPKNRLAIVDDFSNVFCHRFDTTLANDNLHVIDSVNNASAKAVAILKLVSGNLDEDTGRFSDSILQQGVEAAIAYLADIDSIVGAHLEASNGQRATKDSAVSGYTTEPEKISLDELLAMQTLERGIDPMPLEIDLLIKRVRQGGFSGQFLAAAFVSAYRGTIFDEGLKDIIRLDAEGFRLFHQILHIRHVDGWNDDLLYQTEKRVTAAAKSGGVL